MTDASMYALGCRPGRRHNFDWYSGWCRHGCGNREDGRVINIRSGDVIHRGIDYDAKPELLEPIRKRLERKYRRG